MFSLCSLLCSSSIKYFQLRSVDGKKESIKYCARKCHNVGPLTKMMATHPKKFCRTILATAILAQLRSWMGLLVNQHINFGAQIMSPTIVKILLTAMTLVSVASEEGKKPVILI